MYNEQVENVIEKLSNLLNCTRKETIRLIEKTPIRMLNGARIIQRENTENLDTYLKRIATFDQMRNDILKSKHYIRNNRKKENE